MNRTLVEKARCMLIEAGLPKSFWAEAISTAAYLTNRTPSRAVKDQIPEEIWNGQKQSLSHLKVFGSKCMVHIPKEKRKKFDAKSEECVMLGYYDDSKAYRLYHPVKKTIVKSRDVVFMEDQRIQVTEDNSVLGYFDPFAEMQSKPAEALNKSVSSMQELSLDSIVTNNNISERVEHFNDNWDEAVNASENQDVVLDVDDDEYVPETEMGGSLGPLRKSCRIPKPKVYDDFVSYLSKSVESNDPVTVEEALSRSDAKLWKSAMQDEYDALIENATWELTDLPSQTKPIACKWVFKTKRDDGGRIIRHKARLVIKGYAQKKGIDYEETYSPVVRYSSVRFLMALAVKFDLDIDQMDAVTAFLQGELINQDIYMMQPEGYISTASEKVCKLNKSIYGLKQASRVWNAKLDKVLRDAGLKKSDADPCVYYRVVNNKMLVVAIYVDDILILSNDQDSKMHLKSCLMKLLKVKDMGEAKHILGIRITRDRAQGKLWLDQEAYVNQVIKRFNMQDCNPVSTPLDLNQKLAKIMSPQDESQSNEMKNIPYQEAVGSLMFAAQVTRPDICHAAGVLSRFNSNPGKAHWTAAKRVLRYLKGTTDAKLEFSSDDSSLVGYTDSDWAGDLDDRRSTTGYVFKMQGGAITWNSRKQQTVALSTTEAEYLSLSSAVQELLWLKNLEKELLPGTPKETVLYCDNKGAIDLANSNAHHPRTKHIDIRHHFVRDQVNQGVVNLQYVATETMIADAMTKPVSSRRMISCFKSMGLELNKN